MGFRVRVPSADERHKHDQEQRGPMLGLVPGLRCRVMVSARGRVRIWVRV